MPAKGWKNILGLTTQRGLVPVDTSIAVKSGTLREAKLIPRVPPRGAAAFAFTARAVVQCLVGPLVLWVDRRMQREVIRRVSMTNRTARYGSLAVFGSEAFLEELKVAIDLLRQVDPRRARRVLNHLTVVAADVPEMPVAPDKAVYWPSSGVVYIDTRQIVDATDLACTLVSQATHAYVVGDRRIQFGEVARARHANLTAVERERFRMRVTRMNVRNLKP